MPSGDLIHASEAEIEHGHGAPLTDDGADE
jgi:hypothetical protein